jgi:hypothetical protein
VFSLARLSFVAVAEEQPDVKLDLREMAFGVN